MNLMQELSAITGIPLERWTAKKSWLICRLTAESGIICGRAVSGTLKRAVMRDGVLYQITCTGYGWLEREDGAVIDLCRWIPENSEPSIRSGGKDIRYLNGFCPVSLKSADLLPEHLAGDEVFPLPCGMVREICSRHLHYEKSPSGLTMAETAYILSREMTREHRLMILNWLTGLPGGKDLLRLKFFRDIFHSHLTVRTPLFPVCIPLGKKKLAVA